MGLRWRKDGRLLCAAMTEPEDGDIYFDDEQLYEMSKQGVILADPDHFDNALWHWAGQIIPDWNRMQMKTPSASGTRHLPRQDGGGEMMADGSRSAPPTGAH